MDQKRQIEQLVQRVTERVLASLPAASGSAKLDRRLWLLLPLPSSLGGSVSRMAAGLARDGWQIESIIGRDALRAWTGHSLPKAPRELDAMTCDWALSRMQPADGLVIGSLGFDLVRRLIALADDDPWVRLVTQAVLRGIRVWAIADDLAPASGVVQGPLTSQAGSALRDLERLAFQPVGIADLPERLAAWQARRETAVRALGGLLTEADVDRLADEGLSRLRLPAGTIVTPLAKSRAAERGLQLEFEP